MVREAQARPTETVVSGRDVIAAAGTTCDLTATWVLTIISTTPPTPPADDWYSPEKYPPNPDGYVPIAVLEPQTPINEFNPLP